MKKELKYTTEAEYEDAMVEIDRLMKKREADLSDQELHKLEVMAMAAQAYEEDNYYVEPPRTLEGMIELRMYEMKIKEVELAGILGVTEEELSLIMGGKQTPGVAFLKAVHTKLNIPADFILQHV